LRGRNDAFCNTGLQTGDLVAAQLKSRLNGFRISQFDNTGLKAGVNF